MRFSVAALTALAAGAVATTTDIVYDTTTWCPEEASSTPAVSPVTTATPTPSAQPTVTDIISDTTTWCPEEASSSAAVPVVSTPSAKPTPSSSIVTDVVSDYTTWCPEATAITHGSFTYSVTKPTSLTLSNGPYTVSRPLLSKTVTYCNKCAGPTAPAGSSSPSSASVAPVYSGSSVVVPSASQAPGTPASSTPSAPAFTGAASRHIAGAGAGLTAVLGVAAFLL
ncbi:hypothetical protein Plec18167_007113 [Paecilomyces lecythidis]|uniref:Uncharacterized protein n=1 Tax=Paecilomyces lecythidis TaxID=3004212 RepID=A0ABR3X6K7_9EURO